MRITQKDLEVLVSQINTATGSPATYSSGPGNANIGHYHLDYAYGGVKLSRVTNNGGGITNISTDGYGTKKELYSWMTAFVHGLTA